MVDGLHIRCLWIALCYRYFRKLIENNHLYVSQPPLYKISKKLNLKQFKYAYSDEEKDKIVIEFGGIDKVNIQRYKGLTLLALTYFSQYHEGYAIA